MNARLWNDNWKFWEEIDAFSLVWDIPEKARPVTLPHDAMLERAPRPDSPNGGDTGYRDGGNYVYVKTFTVPAESRDKLIWVKFDGVYMNAHVYLNGQLVGKRPNGYAPFLVPLSDYLRYDGENELRVLVKNSGTPNSRWYSGSGIYRDVYWLESAPLHIRNNGVKVTTAYVEEDYAALRITATLCNRDFRPCNAVLTATVYAPDGEEVTSVSAPVAMVGNGEETLDMALTVPDPALWSAETPRLYRCAVMLTCEGKMVDSTDISFGIRTLKLDSRRGLQVNGERVKLRGACVHHDNGLLGAVSVYDAELRRVRLLKEAGFNAIRSAHNPASPALLRACDELGMYVMDEAFDMWSRPKKDNDYALFMDKWWYDDITALVERDYNHPCVVMYSLGNEIPEAGTAQGSALGRAMARRIRELDTTRYVLTSINGVFASGDCVPQIMSDVLSAAAARGEELGNVNNFMTAMNVYMDDIVRHPLVGARIDAAAADMDLVGYNYMAARYEDDAVAYPHRVVVGSETNPPNIVREWPLVKKLPSVIGDFTWTGWDYLGEAGLGIPAYHFGEGGFGAQFPCQLAFCGDIDITGFRRPASYLRQIVFGLRSDPYITVQDPAHYGESVMKTPWIISDSHSRWTWRGFEEKPVVVEIYAPGTEVELLQDGISLGRKPAGEAAGFTAYFETVYRPGKLEAVAYDGETELGRMELTTAGETAKINIEAEPADGALHYVHINLCDEHGAVVGGADEPLTVTVSGGELVGLGSGDPKPKHNYTESDTDTFHGRALAILRRTEGEMTLTAETESGLKATLRL